MSREISFYFVVTGLSLYFLLLGLIWFWPTSVVLTGDMNGDQLVFMSFLTVVFLPVAYTLIYLSNATLRLFSRTVFYLSLIPYILVSLAIFLVINTQSL